MGLQSMMLTNKDLRIEREQLFDEGKDITDAVEDAFSELEGYNTEGDPSLQTRLQVLLDLSAGLATREDYPYVEPSTLEDIREERGEGPRKYDQPLDDETLHDRLLGAWLGRCCGCLLGKPVEGWHSGVLWPYLQATGNFPLHNYLRSDIPAELAEKFHVPLDRAYIDRVQNMVEDDDTNYTITGLAIMDRCGPDFSPEDVASFWLENIPILHTFTAERVAYRNLVNVIPPPLSASYRNPYREWIGAQIRADFWGYAAVGAPVLAAGFAWRDASISHVKNGIYGEMWVAAMLAAAPFAHTMREVIEVGLSEVPANSRLAENIQQVFEWHDRGLGWEEAIHEIHQKWDETWAHHWCHVLSNAQIVAMGLLWGEDDFEKSICRAVQACFDTDCNGATVGSIFGMMHGASALPKKWTGPLNDGLETGVAGYHFVRISEIAKKTADLHQQVRGSSAWKGSQ